MAITLNGSTGITTDIDGDESLTLNRDTSDGDIITLQKDNSAVGSIGIESTGFYVDGEAGHSGLKFRGFDVIPRDNGADIDNGVNLGGTGVRFKDLYLSGGVYVGGTGSANYLDDYEEGTWTPAFNNGWNTSNTNGQYTKIGNKVFVTAYLSGFSSTGSNSTDPAKVVGLPFTTPAGRASGTMFGIFFISGNEDKNVVYVDSTGLYFYGVSSGGFIRILNNGISSNTAMYIQATYNI